MDDVKALVERVFEQKVKDGTFEKIVSEALDKMIADAAKDAMGYGSETRKYVKSKIDETMENAFKQTNFETYVDAFKVVIDTILKDSSVKAYKDIALELKDLLGSDTVAPKEIKLSELFNKFCNFISNDPLDYDDEIESYDGESGYVVCKMSAKKLSWGLYTVTFTVDKYDKDDCSSVFDVEHKFETFIGKDTYGFIRFPGDELFNLKNADAFGRSLIKMSAGYTHVIVDETDLEETVSVTKG